MTSSKLLQQINADTGVVLVLGSGGSRGIVHIGVLRALEELEVPLRAIIGCSMGALVGAFYASGISVGQLESLVKAVSFWDVLKIFAPSPWSNGLLRGKGIDRFLQRHLGNLELQDFPIPFLSVATSLQSGAKTVFDRGAAWSSVRASLSLPGVFPPCKREGEYFIDGAFNDPLPVSVARERFSSPVIAVLAQVPPTLRHPIGRKIERPFSWLKVSQYAQDTALWEITQARLAVSPPDLLLSPPIYGFGCFQYHNSSALIRIGYDYVMNRKDDLLRYQKRANQRSVCYPKLCR